jgi:hypothetical protein
MFAMGPGKGQAASAALAQKTDMPSMRFKYPTVEAGLALCQTRAGV